VATFVRIAGRDAADFVESGNLRSQLSLSDEHAPLIGVDVTGTRQSRSRASRRCIASARHSSHLDVSAFKAELPPRAGTQSPKAEHTMLQEELRARINYLRWPPLDDVSRRSRLRAISSEYLDIEPNELRLRGHGGGTFADGPKASEEVRAPVAKAREAAAICTCDRAWACAARAEERLDCALTASVNVPTP
jgi:hypothetical protein